MKKEKVIRINLPEGAEYRRVEVAVDGSISIIYSEEIISNKASNLFPKPNSLIGGSEVYQKEGIPYWYCKINDRDEFMYLYFGDLTKDDLLYDAEGKKRKYTTAKQKDFRVKIRNALEDMPREGFRWIPVYEPSVDANGELQYVSGKEVLINLNCYEWKEMFKKYSPENGSRMASMTTYYLLLFRLLKDGFATIKQLADDSQKIGHYYDSKDAKHKIEKTGKRSFGGLFGFAGNTCKIVVESDTSMNFLLLGGYYECNGSTYPLADVTLDHNPTTSTNYAVGLLELIG